MRKLLAFLVCLFSFWTWKDFFLRWLWRPASHLVSGETAEHLPSQDRQQESEFAHFLSSLPEDGRECKYLNFQGDWNVIIWFGSFQFTFFHGTGVEAGYREFLEAVVSSKIVFREEVMIAVGGDDSCKHVETFADALCLSNNKFRELNSHCWGGFAVRFAKCISSVLLKNDSIQNFSLDFGIRLKEEMGKELAAEFVDIILLLHNLRVLKSFDMNVQNLNLEGLEQVMKSFQGPFSVLERFQFSGVTSDAQLEHISGLLASNTSLKSLLVSTYTTAVQKDFTRGFGSIAAALCTNQFLKALSCSIFNSTELKVLLEPLKPKNNNCQSNTTLTKFELRGSIGGKEGIETIVDLILTNKFLLELGLIEVDDLSLHGTQGVENILAILEALKTNKSLKIIDLHGCEAVSGYKVLGAIMDLLLENYNIEDIGLFNTGLSRSGDANYVSFALSKRKKMKLWNIVQNMAIVNPTSGRVFLCGQPFADLLARQDCECL